MTDLGDGARTVVGQAVDDHRCAVDAVALVAHLFVIHAFLCAGAALRRALDRVLGHVVVHRLVDGEPKPWIGPDVAAGELRGDRDLADQATEDLAALGVGRRLAVLDVCPLAVPGHGLNNALMMHKLYAPDMDIARTHNAWFFVVSSTRTAQGRPKLFAETYFGAKYRGRRASADRNFAPLPHGERNFA